MKEKTNMTILCPIPIYLKGEVPDHLLFGVNNIEEMLTGGVKRLYYKTYPNLSFNKLWSILTLTLKILTIKHDVLYYGIDPNDLILLTVLKKLRIYRKQIYAWKYIALHGGRLKKMFYDAFDCIFMITERHVSDSVKAGLIDKERCRYVKWGVDIAYVGAIKGKGKTSEFVFIATGKAFRDFDTLCMAFKSLTNVRLKIFTVKQFVNENYVSVLEKYKDIDNIEIYFVDELDLKPYKTVLEYLYAETKVANCALIICKKLNFGVGFTNVLDSMVCGLPIITTWNKDNPIDVDAEKIGYTVEAGNINDLQEKIKYLVAHYDEAKEMGKTARKIIETEYNIKNTAKDVLDVIYDRV